MKLIIAEHPYITAFICITFLIILYIINGIRIYWFYYIKTKSVCTKFNDRNRPTKLDKLVDGIEVILQWPWLLAWMRLFERSGMLEEEKQMAGFNAKGGT